ncbi:DUF4301 family protein [Flammeovirga yaeyamensis]|uniref:DUF4301 family protein n=2 Tax=Flammeovirga yaeyamensis TaxID=367791 RepID=A0AAX1N2Z8_9BACT|nr:DUF4301 family protein [Flammeovirga yaeyamensis]MBB3700536.1 hypothetical protein [Flammeovirga yaeyamensis]NMF37654.1 DUF4301 family protein [Flammeovirga yaeyamensis]QWG01963.1 DUF4301 family protein [Flammeovirga yaeyamensis]
MTSTTKFLPKDHELMEQKGISLETVEKQLNYFKKGFEYANIIRPATLGDGVIKLTNEEINVFVDKYEESIKGQTLLKFVPASGAATRMFKALLEFKNDLEAKDTFAEPDLEKSKGMVADFFNNIIHFPLYTEIYSEVAQKLGNLDVLVANKEYKKILEATFSSDRLHLANRPKGLIGFHKYNGEVRTPVQEHMIEGVHYAKDDKGIVNLHFTVSPEHYKQFVELTNVYKEVYSKRYDSTFEISFSTQKSSTDTIAATGDNEPFRKEEDGELLFRPGGHGALLENLNDIDADIIFIKNIDNVTTDRLKEDTYRYKKALASILVETQSKIFSFLKRHESGERSEEFTSEVIEFCMKRLGWSLGEELSGLNTEEIEKYFFEKLNRPIRVCGMVKNEGEPGGGPFWLKDGNHRSLQIVESAQINFSNPVRREIANASTHFNPVDLVCGVKDFRGDKFDLLQFRNENAGFITHKSRDGQEIQAIELPGLWNGSMAYWTTLFVEVPVSTFTPVKTVNDLLRPEHR